METKVDKTYKKSITIDPSFKRNARFGNFQDHTAYQTTPQGSPKSVKKGSSGTSPKKNRLTATFQVAPNLNKYRKKKFRRRYNKRRSVKKTFLDLDLDLKDTEEKIKAYYKAKEDIANPEEYKSKIREKEEESLSKDLGVDKELEKFKYGFFLEMCLNARLPDSWSKELGKGDRMYYFNRNDGTYSFEHPCLSSFRQLMNNEYKKVLRSFSLNVAKGKNETYLDKTYEFFKGKILSDFALYNIGRFFSLGKKRNQVTLREDLIRELTEIYQKSYGYNILKLMKKLKSMKPMSNVSFEEIRDVLDLLNICKSEYYLVWIARFYIALPLPDGWERSLENDNRDGENHSYSVYKNWITKDKIRVRPSYFYILKLLDIAKEEVEISKQIARVWMIDGLNHVFEDGFSRIYVVENHKLFEKVIDKTLDALGRGLFKMFRLRMNQKVIKKRKDAVLSDPFVEKVEKYIKNPDLNDKHVLLICEQIGLEYNSLENAHLLFFIFNFALKKSRETHWSFRFPNKGEYYWINHNLKRITAVYPFIEELHDELEEHREKIEFRSFNNKFKNLENYRKITNSKNNKEAIEKVAQFRQGFVQQYYEVKNEYNFHLYHYLRQKLDAKIDEFKKRQQLSLHDQVIEIAKKKPKLRHFIPEPFDVSKFASNLIDGVTKEDVKDIIFYNFFNLDKMNRKNLGDEVLKLGTKDVAVRYDFKVKEIKRKERARLITDKLIEDIGVYMEDDDNQIEKMVEDAMRLIELASKVQNKTGLEDLIDVDNDTVMRDLESKNKQYLKVRLDFFGRYGKAGKAIRDKIVLDKWDRIQKLGRKKPKKRKKKRKRNGKRKSKYGPRILPRYRKSRRYTQMFDHNKDEVQSKSSRKSIGSNLRDALEKTILTEMNGERFELNSMSNSEDRMINIFQPISNKATKRKFRKGVNKAKAFLGMINGSKYKTRRSRTIFLTSEKHGHSANMRRSQTSENLQKYLKSSKNFRKRAKNFTTDNFDSDESSSLDSPLKIKAPMSKERKRKKRIFLSALRSHLKIKQKELGILKGINIKDGWLERFKNKKRRGPNTPSNKLSMSEFLGGRRILSSKKYKGNRILSGSVKDGDSFDARSGKSSRFMSSKKSNKFVKRRDSLFQKMGSQISIEDTKAKLEMVQEKFTFNKLLSISDSSYSANTSKEEEDSVGNRSRSSSIESKIGTMFLLSNDLGTSKMIRDFKKHVDDKLGQDLVQTISSNINEKYKNALRKGEKKGINIESEFKNKILKRMIDKSLKKVFKRANLKSNKKRKKLKNMVSAEAKRLAMLSDSAGPADILIKLFGKINASTLDSEITEVEQEKRKALILEAKLYQFGLGDTISAAKNKLLRVLKEFNKFYLYFAKNEVEKHEKIGGCDYESILNLLKNYLVKVLGHFDGWSKQDISSIDEIIDRIKRAFFTHRLKKKFISNRKKYLKLNVFKRLCEMESFSLKRLFLSIRRFLVQFKGSYIGTNPNKIKTMKKLKLKKAVIEFCPKESEVERVKRERRIYEEYKNIVEEKMFDDYVNDPDGFSGEKLASNLDGMRKKQVDFLSEKFKFKTIDKLLEKIVARALFELIDFSKITKIHHKKRGNGGEDGNQKKVFENYGILMKARSLERKLPDVKIKCDDSGDVNTSLNLNPETFKKKMPKLARVNLCFNASNSERKHSHRGTHTRNGTLNSHHLRALGNFAKNRMNQYEEMRLKKMQKKANQLNKILQKKSKNAGKVKHIGGKRVSVSSKKSLRSDLLETNRSKKPSPYHMFARRSSYQIGSRDNLTNLKNRIKNSDNNMKKKREKSGKEESESNNSELELSIIVGEVTKKKKSMSKNSKSSTSKFKTIKIPSFENVNFNTYNESSPEIARKATGRKEEDKYIIKPNTPMKFQKKFFTGKISESATRKKSSRKLIDRNKIKAKYMNPSIESFQHIPSKGLKREPTGEAYISMQLRNAYKEFDDTKISKSKAKRTLRKTLRRNKSKNFIFTSKQNLGIFKGINAKFSDVNPPEEKTENCMVTGKKMKRMDNVIRKEENDAFYTFNYFRKYNSELISKAKLALVEALSPECMDKIMVLDVSCLDEVKKKIENRLSLWIKNVVYLGGDEMRTVGEGRVANRADLRRMPDKKFLSERFKFHLRDLNLDMRKIV